jgi:tetratricopeptide (TPR) repeat protein
MVAVRDWIGWDLALDRRRMTGMSGYTGSMPFDPWQQYAKAVRYKAPLDSIGFSEYLSLPAEERQVRERLARSYRDKADRFVYLVTDVVAKVQADPNGGILWVNMPGVHESVTRCIDYLVTANGVDPAQPEAWYDLAYLSGVVGDWQRQWRCLDAALTAMQDDRSGRYRALHHRICLDWAWSHRDQGLAQQGLVWVDRAEGLLDRDQESTLIRGLLLADAGRFAEACRLARELHAIPVHKMNWGPGVTDFAERWIQSMAYRAEGNMPLACFALGRVHRFHHIPYAHRYYNDVGMLCELNDQPEEARGYYSLAALHNPFFMYYPISSFQAYEQVHGHAAGHAYSVTYNRFYIAGSRFSYGADLVLAIETEQDQATRAALAEQAIQALTICRQRGVSPLAALALRGRVRYYIGDYQEAYADLGQACQEMAAASEGNAETCALAGVLGLELKQYAAAASQLQQALQFDPTLPYVWRAAGVAVISDGDVAQGEQILDRAVALDPTSAVGWYNRGLLNFHQHRWDIACADLQRALQLAPTDQRIAHLLERARKAEQGELVSKTALPPAATGADQDTGGSVAQRQALSPPESALLKESFTESFFYDPQIDQQGAAAMAGTDMSQTLGGMAAATDASWLTLSQQDIAQIVKRLEDQYGANPNRTTRCDLALAYVRAGQAQKGRQLLLPLWQQDIESSEMCIVLEADRALGDMTRARQLAQSLNDSGEPPPLRDATLWSLVASICLDFGLNQEGLSALEAAIALDPGNLALKSHRQLLLGNRQNP